MTTALLGPQPLPLERMRPEVGFLVLVFHLGLLWLANMYWPLQSVLLGAVQSAAQSITVQIIQKSAQPRQPANVDSAAFNANSQAISNTGRQRFGRAEAMLQLPDSQTESTTPLAATQQAVQTARAAQNLPAPPVALAAPKPTPDLPLKPAIDPPVQVTQQAVAAPELPQSAVIPATQPSAVALPAAPPAAAPPLPAAVSAAPLAPAPAVPAPAALVPAASAPALAVAPVAASNPGSSTATSAAPGLGVVALPGSGSAATPAAPLTISPGVGAPLNLSLPPRYISRPPVRVPGRSLSEMANDQLRRKPRDAFAEGIEGAGNIDCLKDAPDGPAQGLLAIGPLLKRALEEKCRK